MPSSAPTLAPPPPPVLCGAGVVAPAAGGLAPPIGVGTPRAPGLWLLSESIANTLFGNVPSTVTLPEPPPPPPAPPALLSPPPPPWSLNPAPAKPSPESTTLYFCAVRSILMLAPAETLTGTPSTGTVISPLVVRLAKLLPPGPTGSGTKR